MHTKLCIIGDQLGLILEPALLERLQIDQDTPLEVSIDGDGITLRPQRSRDVDPVREAMLRVSELHAAAFEKLAR